MKQFLRFFAGILPCAAVMFCVSLLLGDLFIEDQGAMALLWKCSLCCVVLGFAADKLLSRFPSAWPIAASMLLGGVLGFFWMHTAYPGLTAPTVLCTLLGVACGFMGARFSSMGYFLATNSNKVMLGYSFFTVTAIALWLSRQMGKAVAQDHLIWLSYGLLLWFVISLILLADHSLISTLRSDKTGNAPPAVRRANVIYTAIFGAVGLFLAFFDTLRQALVDLLTFEGKVIHKEEHHELEIPTAIGKTPQVELTPGGEEPQMVATWLVVLIVILVLVVLSVLICLLVKSIREKIPAVAAWFRRLMDNLKQSWTQTDRGYTDSSEDLLSWEELKGRSRELRDTLLKRFARRKRLSDCPDDTSKLRFLFASLLVKLNKRSPLPQGMTPQEIGNTFEGENLPAFCADYNRVRYGQMPATAEEVAAAMKTVSKVKAGK